MRRGCLVVFVVASFMRRNCLTVFVVASFMRRNCLLFVVAPFMRLGKMMKIGYFGLEDSFTYLAALKRFGRECEYLPEPLIPRLFKNIIDGAVDIAVVPVENSMGGAVYDVIDELLSDEFSGAGVRISEELYLQIVLNLASKSGLSKIQKVYSHPFPLYFCRQWLEANLPGAEVIGVSSTSEAARCAGRGKSSAAITSAEAARAHRLNLVRRNIGGKRLNVTHFFVLSRPAIISGRKSKKTAAAFSLPHKSGTLYRALGVLAKARINLTRIISRPLRGGAAGRYKFFIEFEGAINEPKVKTALAKLKKQTTWINVISSYPSIKL